MPANLHVLFAGGGSANHLFPGMAVAQHLQKRLPGTQVTFAGSGSARERHVVRSAGYHYTMIPTHPVPRNPLQAVRFVTDNTAGYFAARWMLREQRVSLVVGLGGSTSVAVVQAAAARGIPVIQLEQNAVPGRTMRWLARGASMVCTGFEESKAYFQTPAPITCTGNPVRMAFEDLYLAKFGRGPVREVVGAAQPAGIAARRQRRLIVLGGSGGARSLNQAMPAAAKKLSDRLVDWQIVHQSGDGQLQETENRYAQNGLHALVVTNVDDLASVMFASDLIVCRAHGSQLAEIALAAIPAVLVPFPQSSHQHQLENARAFAAANACRVIDETQLVGGLDDALVKELAPLVSDHHARAELSRNMHKLARPEAAAQVASIVMEHLSVGASRMAA